MKILQTMGAVLLLAFAILPSLATNPATKSFAIPKLPVKLPLKKNLQYGLEGEPPAKKLKPAVILPDLSTLLSIPGAPPLPLPDIKYDGKPQASVRPNKKSDTMIKSLLDTPITSQSTPTRFLEREKPQASVQPTKKPDSIIKSLLDMPISPQNTPSPLLEPELSIASVRVNRDEPIMEDVKYIDLYGRKMLLPEIFDGDNPILIEAVYGDAETLLVVDTDPSINDLQAKYAGIEYMNRVYTHLNPESHLPTLVGTDTPQSIANKLIRKKRNNIMAIVGEKGSGKTVALTKILNLLRGSEENTWTLYIDASKVVPKQLPVDWTAEKMYDNVLDPVVSVLFNRLVNHDPSKVNLLIDNIDKLSTNTQVRLADYLRKIHANGAGVVLAASHPVFMVEELVNSGNAFQIPQLNRFEVEKLMTEHWDKTFNPFNHQEHVEYAKAVSVVLERTSIFQNFATIKELSEILQSKDVTKMLENPNGFMSLKEYEERSVATSEAKIQSLKEYAKNRISDTQRLIEMFTESKFNKLKLVERLMQPLMESSYASYIVPAMETVLSSEREGSYLDLVSRVMVNKLQYPTDLNLDLLQHLDHANSIFARGLIDDVVRGGDRNLLIEKLAIEPRYRGVMEFFNSALTDFKIRKKFQPVFNAIADAGEHEWHSIMDNAISNGHDKIAADIFKAVDSVDKISRYFQNAENNRQMLESTTEYNLGMLTEANVPIKADRYEMMFRKNMQSTIQQLVKFENYGYRVGWKIWRPREFSRYLNDFFLRQSQPNPEIYKIMRNYEKNIRGHQFLRAEDVTKRMYNIIKHADLRSRAIMMDIQRSSREKPWKNSIEGESLVHLAVAKLDKPLLRYVIDDLGCRIGDNSIPLLITALDANPLPFRSHSRFWKTMNFLIKRDYIKVPRTLPPRVNPTPADLASPAYKLISGADPETLSKARDQLIVSNKPIEQLSPEVRHFRRTSVLASLNDDLFVGSTSIGSTSIIDNPTAILEIMIKYRGLDAYLSPKEQNYYEKTIEMAFSNNMIINPTITQEKRLLDLLLTSVATPKDYEFVKKMISSIVSKHKTTNWVRSHVWEQGLQHLNDQWVHMHETLTLLDPFSIESGVAMNRATLFTESRFANTLSATESLKNPKKTPDKMESETALQLEDFEPVAGRSGCKISRRRRRSTSNCLVSKSEYDDFVKVTVENGKKVLTIDTEEFMKKVDNWQFENEGKYQELIEIGKKLVDENNARLGGNYELLFEEHVKPRALEYVVDAQENPTSELGFNDNTRQNSERLIHHAPSDLSKLSEPVPSLMHRPEFIPPHTEFSSRGVYHDNFRPQNFEHPLPISIKSFPKPYQFQQVPEFLQKVELIKPAPTFIEMPSIPHSFEMPIPKLRIGLRGK